MEAPGGPDEILLNTHQQAWAPSHIVISVQRRFPQDRLSEFPPKWKKKTKASELNLFRTLVLSGYVGYYPIFTNPLI